MRFTLEDIFNIPTAEIYNPGNYKSITSVSIDSRTLKKHSIFVAIKGKNFDGHNFVNEAIAKGAKAVIINKRKLKDFCTVQLPIITVKNTTDAFAELARVWRNKFKGKIISITGSNGKTTTKEILADLLSAKFKVYKTHANNNNHIGVPLTLLSSPSSADYIVLEHGTNHKGEIEYTARIARPDYALITNIGNSHTEFLGSKENILHEKIELFNHCRPGGTVFINIDDPLLSGQKRKFNHKVTFGFNGRCDVKGRRTVDDKKIYDKITIEGFGKKIEAVLPLLGKSNSQNFLAASAIAMKLGVGKRDIVQQTKKMKSVKGRLELFQFPDFMIIDDTYNSNPDSVKAALDLISSIKNVRKKIVLFGDMFELGKDAENHHREIASLINKTDINEVYTIGKHSKLLHEKIRRAEISKHFRVRTTLKNYLKRIDLQNSLILVKGSRGMKMEDFVNEIKGRVE